MSIAAPVAVSSASLAVWALAYLFAYLVAAPVLTLVHELAHALVTLVGANARVTVRLGREPPLARFRLGRLSFALRPWPGYLGSAYYDSADELSRARLVVGALAAPLATAACSIVLFGLAFSLQNPWRPFAFAAAYWAAFQFAVTIIPFTYPRWWSNYGGRPSDGLRALRLLQGAPSSVDPGPSRAQSPDELGPRS